MYVRINCRSILLLYSVGVWQHLRRFDPARAGRGRATGEGKERGRDRHGRVRSRPQLGRGGHSVGIEGDWHRTTIELG